jgi:DNA-binding beta-propeller fold protein YncE
MIARFREPIDNLAIAGDGTIYISNVADSAVYAYHPKTGARRDVVRGLFSMTLGMSLTTRDGRETLIVADPFGYRYVDTATGEVSRPFWAANRGASSAVAETARFIAYTYAGSNRVKKLDRQADALTFENTDLKAPRGVAINGAGEVIVADMDGGRIVKIDGSGVRDLAKDLQMPIGLALDGDGAAWVTEFATGAVKRVDLVTGKAEEIAKGLAQPTAVAVMTDGRLAVVESGVGRVSALDPKTGQRAELASGLALSLQGLDMPPSTNGGIAVGADGTVYVSCPGNNTIVAIAPGA